jgi:hypothetical protein
VAKTIVLLLYSMMFKYCSYLNGVRIISLYCHFTTLQSTSKTYLGALFTHIHVKFIAFYGTSITNISALSISIATNKETGKRVIIKSADVNRIVNDKFVGHFRAEL